ncbi:MAG: thioredoxin-like domain-containing protein [Planctomycetota bacterium]
MFGRNARMSAALAAVLLTAVASLYLVRPAKGQIVAPELEPNLGWLNTQTPLRFDGNLEGHVVLLDFWTYCCINCLHVLPDLEYLEAKYADEPFVVVGVHSAKFEAEGERSRIRNAMFRYDVKHPVVVDDRMQIWRQYGARSWPTFVLIGADGKAIGMAAGEGNRELLDGAIRKALDEAREAGTLAEKKVTIVPDAEVASPAGLRYPGKILAIAPSERDPRGWLFVADSSNDRIVASTYPDSQGRSEVRAIFGGGRRGLVDAAYEDARFHDPQGFAYDADRGEAGTLFVADTKNHVVRAIDLASGEVSTVLGTGEQSYDRRGGKAGREQGLGSPWDLALSPDGENLYIAMAGTHQIWAADTASWSAAAIAGSGRENSLDGPAMDAALAQPSGLALSSDGGTLYFADSESSSLRAVDLELGQVRTIVGHNVEYAFENGLFEFGDIDGAYPTARLQHCIGAKLLPTPEGDRVLVADTYNDKIKIVDPTAQTSRTWTGVDRDLDAPPSTLKLAEPAGLWVEGDDVFIADTNNHRVVRISADGSRWVEVSFDGLDPVAEEAFEIPAVEVGVSLAAGRDAMLTLAPTLPEGAKANAELPMVARVLDAEGTVVAQSTWATGELPKTIGVPGEAVADGASLRVELAFAYCYDDEGLCVPVDLAWAVEVAAGESSEASLAAIVE